MSKTLRTLLSVFAILVIGVLVAYLIHRMCIEQAQSSRRIPEWAKPLVSKLGPYQERLAALHGAREALQVSREEGIARLREVIQSLKGTGEAWEAKIILARTLAQGEAAERQEALDLLGEVVRRTEGTRRSLRARLLRARMLLSSDPAAAKEDLRALTTEKLSFAAPSLHADASIALARLHMDEGQPLKAIGLLEPILSTGLGQKAEATDLLREAIHAHARGLAEGGQWEPLIAWADQMIKKFPDLPGLKNRLDYHQAIAHRHLQHYAQARTILDRLRRDVPVELLEPEIDLDGEFAALTQAEEAVGILRTPRAFLQAKERGEETRPHFAGEVATDTTWSAVNTPLVLTGVVTVPPGTALTLAPGARVEFLQGARIVVHGALVAAGTAEQPVLLTSAVRQPEARCFFDGEGVELARDADLTRTRIEHVTVEYQRIGLACRGLSVDVGRCTFQRNGEAGLLVTDGARPVIEACTFQANDSTALRAEKASPVIRRCRFLENGRSALVLEGDSTPTIESNRIVQNGRRGIACDNSVRATIRHNLIQANGGDGVYCNRLSEAVIQENILQGNAGYGVRCERDSECQIEGNAIQGNTRGGVSLSNTDAVVRANRIVNNKHYGVECITAAPLIEGNLIDGNVSAGISCIEASQPTIHRNAIGYHDPSYIGNAGGLDIDARENYFFRRGKAPSEEALEKGLFHAPDNTGLGTIHWKPRLAERPPDPPMPTLENLP